MHSWRITEYQNGKPMERCSKCHMLRRKKFRIVNGKYTARYYPVTEYSRDNGKTWAWITKRMSTPKCEVRKGVSNG